MKRLPDDNPQEVVDFIVKHLLDQGRPSYTRTKDHDNFCLYRGPDGLSCAAGCLIRDSEYTLSMEGSPASSIHALTDRYEESMDYIDAAQYIHDCAADYYERELSNGIEPDFAKILEECAGAISTFQKEEKSMILAAIKKHKGEQK